LSHTVVRALAGRQRGAVAQAKDRGVDRDRLLAEGDIEQDVGGLAPLPGQRLEGFARAWPLAAMLFDELLRQRDEVLGLGAIEADGLDVIAQLRFAELEH